VGERSPIFCSSHCVQESDSSLGGGA
jgi:hypothetical protein